MAEIEAGFLQRKLSAAGLETFVYKFGRSGDDEKHSDERAKRCNPNLFPCPQGKERKMKQPLLITAFVSATIFGAAAVLPAVAQERPPQEKTNEQMAPSRPDRFPVQARSCELPVHFALELAAKLSAAETYLGITSEQLGSWRAYTTALQDVISFGPDRGPLSDRVTGIAENQNTSATEKQNDNAAPELGLPGEALAKAVLEKAEKAKSLQNAAGSLRSVLTPDQLDKLSGLGGMMIAPPPMHGPSRDGVEWHGGGGPRG